MGALRDLCTRGSKVKKSAVESFFGLLIWHTSGMVWLRPWLSVFYLRKPMVVTRLLLLEQFAEEVANLKSDRRVKSTLPRL